MIPETPLTICNDENSPIKLAEKEARNFGQNFVGTEHVLLALFANRDNIAAQALRSHGLNYKQARKKIQEIVGHGAGALVKEILLTPRTQRVIDFSMQETRKMGHVRIGPEHLLLGIIKDGDGVAVRVLQTFGVDLQKLRATVIELCGKTSC